IRDRTVTGVQTCALPIWRPTIVAQHGMVAAGRPLAAEAGLRILKAGGNAVDTAVATWAVQGEFEPGMTGLGADMFLLIYFAKTGDRKSTRLNSSHRTISYAVFCLKKKKKLEEKYQY